jgi:hypothetical protein
MAKSFGDWIVDERGLYNEEMDYLVEANRICEEREAGTPKWALQLIEKTWVEPEDFVPALKFALEHFRCGNIDWEKTLAALQADAYEEIVTEEARRRLNLDASLGMSGEDGRRLLQEVNRLKSFAWRPRKWTSRDIRAKRQSSER